MKRCISLLLVLSIVILLLPIPAFSTTVIASGELGSKLTWELDDIGTLTIKGTGATPSYSSGDTPWYALRDAVKQIIVEDGVTSLGNHLFYDCVNVTQVLLSDSITSLGDRVFYRCENLSSITLPNSVTYIGDGAFNSCSNLRSIYIPKVVTTLGDNVFIRCSQLSHIEVDPDNIAYTSDSYGVLFSKDMSILYEVPDAISVESYKIPAGVVGINDRAFEDCIIKEVYIPDTVKSIGEYVFMDCANLEIVNIPETITTLRMHLFAGCSSLTEIVLPDSITNIEGYTFNRCTNLRSIVLPSKLTTISYRLFSECEQLQKIVIHENINTIKDYAFNGCKSLTLITFLGDAPTFYEENCFRSVNADVYYPGNNPTWTNEVMQNYGGELRWKIADCDMLEVNHITSDPVIENECNATCESSGSYDSVKYCITCNKELERTTIVTNAIGHTEIIDTAIAPTCTKTGLSEGKHCSICKKVIVAKTEIPALGHSWNGGEVTKEPTEDKTGIRTFTCTVCGDTKTEEIPVLEHTHKYESIVTAPTCTEDGYTTYTCKCGEHYIDDEVAALGHYEMTDQGYDATCTEPGLTDGTHCNRCGKVLSAQTEIPAKGHSWDNGVVTREPTEEEAGIRTFTCAACGETRTEEIAPLGHTHNYATTVTKPTCTERGYTTYTCKCGDSYVDDYVDALGHTAVADPGVDATCSNTGLTEGSHCSVCNEVIVVQEVIPVTDHAPADPVRKNEIAPTCSTEGSYDEVVYCSVCDREISRTTHTVEKTEHTYQDGVCTECNQADPDYEAPAKATVSRIAGADRIGTALSVAAALKDTLGIEKFDTIILAAGGSGQDQTKFADALSGSYLASSKKAPILLYTKGDLAEANLAFIAENLSEDGTIYLLGGNVSIPAEVEAALIEAGYNVKRLGGNDRYHTNLLILDEAGIEDAKEVLIAGGQAFADSLSASATGLPIMLVNGTKAALTEAQIEFLKGLEGKKITILGGNAAVSAELEAAIKEAVGTEVERVFGETREATSAMIAKKYFPEADKALIVYSRMYPDGLAGGVLANVLGAPLLLTNSGKEAVANEYIEATGIEAGYVLGGTAVVTDETAKAVFGLAEDAVIPNK